MTPASTQAQRLRALADRLDKLGHSGGQACREGAELIEALEEFEDYAEHDHSCSARYGRSDDPPGVRECGCGLRTARARLAEVEGRVKPQMPCNLAETGLESFDKG